MTLEDPCLHPQLFSLRPKYSFPTLSWYLGRLGVVEIYEVYKVWSRDIDKNTPLFVV